MTTLDYAKAYAAAGFSVIPVALDGSKKPVGSWKPFMSERATSRQITAWFGLDRPYGIGLVHGAVSGNSCVIDIDDAQTAHDYISLVQSVFPDIDLLAIDTPSSGLHLLFRYPDGAEVPGNLKLARFKDGKTRIETRGEGGYTIAPGSPESVHPSGKMYWGPSLRQNGQFVYHELLPDFDLKVPTYDATTIDTLIALAKSFDESPEIQRQAERQRAQSRENSPGADYTAQATNQSMLELLEKHGWQHHHTRANGVIEITRPGKNTREGVSATIGHCGEGNLYVWSSNAPGFEAGRIYAPFTVYGRLEHNSDFTAAARELGATGYGEQNPPAASRAAQDGPEAQSGGEKPTAPPAPKESKPNAAKQILDFVLGRGETPGNYDLFNFNSVTFATTRSTPALTFPVKSEDFARRLYCAYHAHTNQPAAPSAIKSAIETIDAIASMGVTRRVWLRKAVCDMGNIYIDLGSHSGRVVEITPKGWSVVDTCPVRFIRPQGMHELPEPQPGGNIEMLRPLINLPKPTLDELGTPDQFVLAVAFLLACFGPHQPYPCLAVSGEMGSAKSNLTKILKALVDPSATPLVGMPSKEDDLPALVKNAFLPCFDNVSHVNAEFSDKFARISTGAGFVTRRLFTDHETAAVQVMLPMILNGIGDLSARPDLVQRSILLNLRRIAASDRKFESDIQTQLDRDQPQIFGAILDAVAEGLKNLPTTNLTSAPRMADFALWVAACEPKCPWSAGEFLATYSENQQTASITSAENDKLINYILVLCGTAETDFDAPPAPKPWKGSGTQLREAILDLARKDNDTKDIPSTIGVVRRLLDRSDALRRMGYSVDQVQHGGKRIWKIVPPGSTESEVEATPAQAKPKIGTKITTPPPPPAPGYMPPVTRDVDGLDDDPFAE